MGAKETNILNIVMDTGVFMMTSGAETYRVEETILRMLSVNYPEKLGVFVTPTVIQISLNLDNGESYSAVRSIKSRSRNLEKVSLLNDLSRKYVSGQITIDDVEKELENIKNKITYSWFTRILAICFTCILFTLLPGCSISDLLSSLIVGIFLGIFLVRGKKYINGIFLSNFLGGLLIGVLVPILHIIGIGDNTNTIISGTLMPMVPGVAFTNAIREILEGDYMSGLSRGVEAIIIALSMALGAGVGLKIIETIYGGIL